MRRRVVAGFWQYVAATSLFVGAVLAPRAGAGADDAQAVEHGRDLYRIYCANCHGPSGHGDGPTASALEVRPTDLTLLAGRNGGEFPRQAVWDAIDGRADVPSHRSGTMPIWGLAFQDPGRDVGQEDEVRTRIGWLVAFLLSIQDPPATAAPAEDPSG